MPTTVGKLLIRLTKFSNKTSNVIDATAQFNAAAGFYQDLSGWDEVVVQVISPSETISFFTTNDDGSVTGQLLPAPEVPINWLPVLGTDLRTNSTSLTVALSAHYKFATIGKYLGFFGASITSTTTTTAAPTTTTTTSPI
jgi:hypothetical protein